MFRPLESSYHSELSSGAITVTIHLEHYQRPFAAKGVLFHICNSRISVGIIGGGYESIVASALEIAIPGICSGLHLTVQQLWPMPGIPVVVRPVDDRLASATAPVAVQTKSL